MRNSKIEWCDDTWNPIVGCTRVSQGCVNCYAEGVAARFSDPGQYYHGIAKRTAAGPRWTGELRLMEDKLDQPLRWRRPRRIFVNSMSDLFHEKVPDEWIDRVFAVMALAPQHTFQVLTKRPERMRDYMAGLSEPDGEGLRDAIIEGEAQKLHHERTGEDPSMWLAVHLPLPNVWLGVSAEDQATANERIPRLLETPAAIRFLSAEPLLGPLNLMAVDVWMEHGGPVDALRGVRAVADKAIPEGYRNVPHPALDWVIVGGESGPNARPAHPQWFRDLRDQCLHAGAAFHFKQWGAWASVSEVEGPGPHHQFPDYSTVRRVGKAKAGRTLDGRTWDEMPETRT